MRLLCKIVGVVSVAVLIGAGIGYVWLYLYTSDLPSIAGIHQYNPPTPSEIHLDDGSITHVVPRDRLGRHLINAVLAAEGQPESRSPIRFAVAELLSDTRSHGQLYSLQIARRLVPPSHTIRRQIDQLRLAEKIQRYFDSQQILTIYLNQIYLGENVYGVEDASMRYFGKHAAELRLDEAALLAGMIRSPSHDSPTNHPERAVQRRNWVIDQMVSRGSVSPREAEQTKALPLIVKHTADSEATYDWNRCTMEISNHASPPDRTIRMRPGEKPTGQLPVITFRVLESGEVKNAVISRSSGIGDIDNYALARIRSLKYKERPLGCGVIESQAVVNVDFF